MRKQLDAGGHFGNAIRFLPLLPVALGLALAAPQPPGEGGDPLRITVDVSMVVLQATVLGAKGGFVKGLPEADFQVFEDGVRQQLRLFRNEEAPVAVGLIVDNSTSMREKRKDVAEAAQAFVTKSNPQDEMFVINFNDRPVPGLPAAKLFSADPGELGRALSSAETGGRTALYDAIGLGLVRLQKSTQEKKVLIVIGDGGDNASHRDLASTLQAAKSSDVTIYTIGLFDEYDDDSNPKVLKQFARITGGEAFLPYRPDEATRICERIAEEIRSQYTLGYVSSNPKLDGTYRKIQIKVAAPHRGKLTVRAREGYVAGSNPKSAPGETM